MTFDLNSPLFFPAIQDLEQSASSDAIVREKIASLPPEVSEVSHLEKLQSVKEGQQLMKKVKDTLISWNFWSHSTDSYSFTDSRGN